MSIDTDVETTMSMIGLNAPRVSVAQIEALMEKLAIHTTRIPETNTTVAVATLPDGFTVAIGMSACVSSSNFNAEIGIKVAVDQARAKAREKLWELEGYALRCKLADRGQEML